MIARPHSLTDLAIKPLPATISLILAPDPVIQSLYTQWPRAKVTWRYGRPLHSDPHSTSGFIDVLFTDDRRLEVEPRTSTDNPRQREWLVWALDDRGELLSYAYTPPLLAASSSEDHASAIAKCARRCFANAALDDIRLAASDQAFRDPQRILMALRSFFAGIPEEPNSLNCVEGFLSFMEAARSLLPLDLNVDPRGHSDPAANGYSTSTNFNELHATKMRELDADPAIPRPKRRERVPTPSAPTASGYSTSPNYTAMFNQRMAELRVSKPEIFAPTKPKPRSRRSKTREMDPPA